MRMSATDYARLVGGSGRAARPRTRKAGYKQSLFIQDAPPAPPHVLHSSERRAGRGHIDGAAMRLARVQEYLDRYGEGDAALRNALAAAQQAVRRLAAEWERAIAPLPDPDPRRAAGKIGRQDIPIRRARRD